MMEKEEKSVLCVMGKGGRSAMIVAVMAKSNALIAGVQDTIRGEIIVTDAMVRDIKSVIIAMDEDMLSVRGALVKGERYAQLAMVLEK